MDNEHRHWEPGFHLRPPAGWLNDPNGLCQFRGVYHIFFQYSPDWPGSDLRSWGHFASDDLLHWDIVDGGPSTLPGRGVAISPSIPQDRTGAFSGSALVQRGAAPDGGDLLRLYYTGNVIHTGGYDYVHEGREANEILVTSEDGRHLGAKHVLLRNEDYPADCTLHVRDPKVWEQDGLTWMLLGARNQDDMGQVLVYVSHDCGDTWEHHHTIRPDEPLGYMWECPNIVRLPCEGGRMHDFLAVCPQGLPSEELRWHNHWQSGYFPLGDALIGTQEVQAAGFVEWDCGWDFYAPQAFEDDSGRTLLMGWMGTFDKEWDVRPKELGWCHCLTVPRELSLDKDGLLLQWPAHELEGLRMDMATLGPVSRVTLPGTRADVVVEGMADGSASLVLDDSLEISLTPSRLKVVFLDPKVGAGRTSRTVPLRRPASSMRVLVDGSCVELYVNDGELAFSTRWFPTARELSISLSCPCASACAWTMADALAATYGLVDGPN